MSLGVLIKCSICAARFWGGLKFFGEMLLSFLVLSMLSLLAGWSRPSSSSTMKRGGWAALERLER